MRMDRFHNELKYSFFYLSDARSILLTSFFSHKTISYLDLQIIKNDLHSRLISTRRYKLGLLLLKKSFLCTEESFRNHLVPNRRLMYTLNLDVPNRREYSNLRNGSAPAGLRFNYKSLFVAVKGCKDFFKSQLVRFIESALERTDCKMKLLKWMADFRPLESFILPLTVQKCIAMTLYCECMDPEFAMKFFLKFLHFIMFLNLGEVKHLEYFLYHAKLCDLDVRIKKSCCTSFADYCIENYGFLFVHSFLKFEDTVYYTETSYEVYKKNILPNCRCRTRVEESSRPVNQLSKLRLYRILQILQIFERHENHWYCNDSFRRPDVSEALRLVWSSIPDSFISLQEMSDAYGHVVPSEVISQAHSFYEKAISETVSYRRPRPLTHYCRSVIRKSLYDSKQWLPDGIKQLKLPPRLEAFLNLQLDNLRPENFHAP